MKPALLPGLLLLVHQALAAGPPRVEVLAGLANNTLSVNATTTGSLGEPLQCLVKNIGPRPVTVRLPAGLCFEPGDDPGRQNLMTVQEQLLVLAPNASQTVLLAGYCMEKHDRGPQAGLVYTLKGLAAPNPKILADSLQKYPGLVPDCAQMMLWTLTDAAPLHPLEVEPRLLRAARNLMRFVSERGHVPAASVSAGPASSRTGGAGRSRVRLRTFSKTAGMLYHSPVAQKITLNVYEADGSLRYALFQNKSLSPGVVHYTFGLNEMVNAEGPAPVYFFRLLDAQGKVLKETRVDDATVATDATPRHQKFAFNFSLTRPLNNVVFRVRLPDGTLVEEVHQQRHLPVGNFKYSLAFNHLYPPGTAFVAKLESLTGEVYKEQAIE